MQIWMSGEIEADVEEGCRLCQNEIQATVNAIVSHKFYGDLKEWALIPIILSSRFQRATGFDEIKKFHRDEGEVEFRLKIDHTAFRAADDLGKRRLMFSMILRSTELFDDLGMSKFDIEAFRRDLMAVGAQHGWLENG